ncbi:MAG: hypothetical protein AAF298_22075 [Cyanobacteria bacterium P01_A01_bin.40]
MSWELTATTLLSMALGGIVGNAASDGVRDLQRRLWQTIKNRLLQNQPIEAEIIELEQNPTEENLKPLEAFLQVEMHRDKVFAEAISKLGQEIAEAKGGDTINIDNVTAQDNAVVIGKAEGQTQYFGGTHLNLGKD